MSTTKKDNTAKSNLEKEALDYHKKGRPGKLEITPTTPLISSHDLSLAYSPGVATPCLEIEKNQIQFMIILLKVMLLPLFQMVLLC